MTATQVYIMIFAILALACISLAVFALKFGLKFAKVADISIWKTIGVYLLIFATTCVVAICVVIGSRIIKAKIPDQITNVFDYFVTFVVSCLAIAVIFRAPLWRAAVATISMWSSVVFGLLIALGIRICAYEAFVVPANSMAPTLVGEHWEAPCPRCGAPAYGSALDQIDRPRFGSEPLIPPEGVMMVCSKEMTSVYVHDKPQKRGDGDRFAVCKLLRPRRWDLIAFQLPENPAVKYVKRLVGLPGEKLEIRDGAVWINGEKLEPPEAIRGIRYSPTIESHGQVFSGPGSLPVQLGPDEYFVLGDFVDQSSDSRLWEKGAPNHHPFAVPESHLVGVVINIYWPVSRWRSFR
jgi:signal peptidase I